LRIQFAIAVLVLVGCSDDSLLVTPDIPSRDSGNSDAATAEDIRVSERDVGEPDIARVDVPPSDSGQEDTDPGDTTTEDARDPTQAGGIIVFEVRAPGVGDLESGGVGANFDLLQATPGSAPVASIGACEIRDTSEGADILETGPSFDAGQITIGVADTNYALDYIGETYVSNASEEQIEFFAAGDTITMTAAGGLEVDGFEMSVIAPADPTITAPVWGSFDGGDRDEPLSIVWTGSGGTSLVISIIPVEVFPEPGVADGNAITCTVEDTGSYTVPVEALAYLPEPEGFGGGTVALTVVRVVNETEFVGITEVTANATASHTIVGTME
jgi:hypothetical protein